MHETWAYVLAALFMVSGLIFTFLPTLAKRFRASIRTWHQAEAQVISIQEETHDYKTYRAKLEYQLGKRKYKCEPKQTYLQREQVPERQLIYINPKNPRDVYTELDLQRMQSGTHLVYLMAACFFFMGLGFLVYLQYFSQGR